MTTFTGSVRDLGLLTLLERMVSRMQKHPSLDSRAEWKDRYPRPWLAPKGALFWQQQLLHGYRSGISYRQRPCSLDQPHQPGPDYNSGYALENRVTKNDQALLKGKSPYSTNLHMPVMGFSSGRSFGLRLLPVPECRIRYAIQYPFAQQPADEE